jgi:microsomal epoxide hydrolase
MPQQKSTSPFAAPPSGTTLSLHPFQSHVPQADLDRLKRKLNDTEDIPSTYENSFAPAGMELGVRKGWMEEMLGLWRGEYDWRKTEIEFNEFPHYTTPISTGGHNHTVHFMALFSQNKDAVPVVMTHGWPGQS